MTTYAHGCQADHEPGVACEHGPSCSDCYRGEGCTQLLNWCPVCEATYPLDDDDCRRCDGVETSALLKKAREQGAAERQDQILAWLREFNADPIYAVAQKVIAEMLERDLPLRLPSRAVCGCGAPGPLIADPALPDERCIRCGLPGTEPPP